jgi:tripartite-type tricarboxylate transporter receptor subunit TctC
VTKLHDDIVTVLQAPDTRNKLKGQGGDPGGNTPEQFTALLREELVKWAKLVKAANIKLD